MNPARGVHIREGECVCLIIHKYPGQKTSVRNHVPGKIQRDVLVASVKKTHAVNFLLEVPIQRDFVIQVFVFKYLKELVKIFRISSCS